MERNDQQDIAGNGNSPAVDNQKDAGQPCAECRKRKAILALEFPNKTPRCISKEKIERLKSIGEIKDPELIKIYNEAFRNTLTAEHLMGGVRKSVVRDLNKYYEVVNRKE